MSNQKRVCDGPYCKNLTVNQFCSMKCKAQAEDELKEMEQDLAELDKQIAKE